jgi:hypothetical protein
MLLIKAADQGEVYGASAAEVRASPSAVAVRAVRSTAAVRALRARLHGDLPSQSLVVRDRDKGEIASSLQLIAGRVGQALI